MRDQYREHAAYLRELRRRLRGDRDPRTSNMVKKLKQVYDRLWSMVPDVGADENAASLLTAVHRQVRDLYDSCVKLLERSLQLWGKGPARCPRTRHERGCCRIHVLSYSTR